MYDNLKFFLIVLVVIGHTITSDVVQNSTLKSMFIFIYSFHMPLFLFISGLFQNKNSNTLNRKKIVTYIILGLMVKMLVMFIDGILFTSRPKFSLFNEDGLFWYLFVLAYYNVICYILRKMDKSLVFFLSMLLALLIGYDDSIGDFLCLSRAIVFFPFYYVGFCLTPKQVMDFCNKKTMWIPSILLVFIWLVVTTVYIDDIYTLRGLFTGRNSYNDISKECDMLDRLIATIISGIVSLSFICISVNFNRYIPIVSNIGQRTLQIYFWHSILLKLLRYLTVFERLEDRFPNLCWILFIVIGIAITLCLSMNIFNKPIKYIMNSIDV